jgi:hypothetical protein
MNLIKILRELINELNLSDHYINRKKERGTILSISLSKDAYEGYQFSEVKDALIPKISKEYNDRLSRLESTSNVASSNQQAVGYKIIKPFLINNNTKYPIKLIVESTKNDKLVRSEGNTPVVIIIDNTLITLLVLNNPTDAEIEKQIKDHIAKKITKKTTKKITNLNYKVLQFNDLEYKIDFNTLMGNVVPKDKILPEDLPYTLKTAYRPKTQFTHKTYGTGTVIAAASAGTRSGEPDSRGIVDWVEVDFGKPYVSGGKLQTTRRIPNVYTTLAFK